MDEPWKCAGPCQQLMYNVEFEPVEGSLLVRKIPFEGAPGRKYVDGAGYCCSLCFEMFQAVNSSTYFVRLHSEWKDERDRANKLRVGGNYLGGV